MVERSAKVLCVGQDDAAMQTRLLLLEGAGHKVIQARDLRQVQAACESNAVSVVVLGHSLSAGEKWRITDVALTHCKNAKVLELHTGIAPAVANADAHLQVTAARPEDFVETVNNLLGTPTKKNGKAT